MSLSPIPVADAAMDTGENRCSDDTNMSFEKDMDSIADHVWSEIKKAGEEQSPILPPKRLTPQDYGGTVGSSQEAASSSNQNRVEFNGIQSGEQPVARPGQFTQSIGQAPPPVPTYPTYTGANAIPHGNLQPKVDANPPAPPTSLGNLASNFTSMLNQRFATGGNADTDPIQSTQCYPPTSQEIQPPQGMDHRGNFPQGTGVPRAQRRRRDPIDDFVDPNASPPKEYYRKQAEELQRQLIESQAKISEVEKSAKTAMQSGKEQMEQQFALLTAQWQANAMANIKEEMDNAELKYREQVAIESQQRQELVDQRLADSDRQIATIQTQAAERESQIRFEAEETIRKQHLEFEKMKEHAIVQFNQVETRVVGDASDEMRKHVQLIEHTARAEIADLKEKFMFREQNLEAQILTQEQTLEQWQRDIRSWHVERKDLTSALAAAEEAHQIASNRAQRRIDNLLTHKDKSEERIEAQEQRFKEVNTHLEAVERSHAAEIQRAQNEIKKVQREADALCSHKESIIANDKLLIRQLENANRSSTTDIVLQSKKTIEGLMAEKESLIRIVSERDATIAQMISAAQVREDDMLKSMEKLQEMYEKKCEEFSIATPRICEPCGPKTEEEEDEWEEDWEEEDWNEEDCEEEEKQDNPDHPVEDTASPQARSSTEAASSTTPIVPQVQTIPYIPPVPFKENDEVKVPAITHKQSELQDWIDTTIKSVMSASGRPNLAKKWMDTVLTATTFQELAESEERTKKFGNFDSLCGKFGLSMTNHLKGHLKKKIQNIEIANKKETGDFLNGQQIFWLVIDHLRNDDKADKMIKDQQDLMALEMKNDNLQGYVNAFDKLILQLDKQPEEDTKFFLFTEQIKKSTEIREEWKFREILRKKDGTVDTFKAVYDFVDQFLADKHRESTRLIKETTPKQPKWGGNASPAPQGDVPPYKKGMCHNFYYWGSCPTQTTNCPWTHNVTCNPQGKGRRGRGKGRGNDKSGGKKGDGKDKNKNQDKCNKCGKPGHKAKDCWSTTNDGGKSKSKSKDSKGKDKGKSKGKGDKGDKGKGDGGKKRGRTEERSSSVPTRGKSPTGQTNRPICWKGDSCPGKADKTCTFWHPGNCKVWNSKGTCALGDQCPFTHDTAKAATGAPASKKAKANASKKEISRKLAVAAGTGATAASPSNP